MGFLDREKERQAKIRRKLFSPVAQIQGQIRGSTREFALNESQAHENLQKDLRDAALVYFKERDIPWHMATHDSETGEALPTNHLCSSQVNCVNSLWPFVVHSELHKRIMGIYYPEMAKPLEMVADGPQMGDHYPFLSFEWIGEQNYLGEVGDRFRKGGERQRGALATSADFAFRFRRHDGRIQLVLGEWKYTESYPNKEPDTNETRRRVYEESFDRWKAQNPDLPEYEHFFVEPFYQLMRMTLLAKEMERAKETGTGEMEADVVTVCLIAPSANEDYTKRVTSAGLKPYGNTVHSIWSNLMGDKFRVIPTESLLTASETIAEGKWNDWARYMTTRYGWWR